MVTKSAGQVKKGNKMFDWNGNPTTVVSIQFIGDSLHLYLQFVTQRDQWSERVVLTVKPADTVYCC